MRLVVRLLPWALLGCLLLVVALAAGLWLAIEPTPAVEKAPAVAVDDIARARAVLARNDPRNALPGITRAVLLTQRDLDLLLNQAGQRFGGLRGRVRLQPGLAVVDASLPLPASPWGGWLNLHAVLLQTDGLPAVQRLHIGRLPVPGWLAEAMLPRLLTALNLRAQGELAQRLVSRVGFHTQALVLAYAWPDNLQQSLTDSLLDADAQARLRRHADALAALTAQLGATREGRSGVSLARLLPPVFQLAGQHSTDAASAVAENRAALVALAFMAHGDRLAQLLAPPPPASAVHPMPAKARLLPLGIPPQPRITLAGRTDFPQHLLISAALAAEGGGPLSDAIGLYKEVDDSRGGSGFSFRDLAADRAGTRLGLLARRDPLALQARLAAARLADADLLPDTSDLPEDMPEAEFKRRFGGIGAPAYLAVLQEIEARLDRLPLLAPGR